MILHKNCPICNSPELKGYSIDCSRNGPHISRVICLNCTLVFANPMADFEELNVFYQNYYTKGNFGLLNYKDRTVKLKNTVDNYTDDKIRDEAAYINDYKTSGNFLDVGCGLGAGLIYANRLKFNLFGTELDTDAISFINDHFDASIFHGDLLNANYQENFFDYVYLNHVIEHVLDPKKYISEIFRILKPGGILYIGTPNISSPIYKLYRRLKFASFEIPQIIDGIEHTFLFNQRTLRDLCLHSGFKIVKHKNLSLIESIDNIRNSDMNTRKKIMRYIQTKFNINQELICKK